MKQRYKVILYLIVLTLLKPEISKACKPIVSWGSSISFCQGNSITLNAANANSTYSWSTGATGSSITVSTSGTYWVSVSNQCGTTSDTIQVIVDKPVNVNLGPDRAICAGSAISLSAPLSASASYYWQNGYTGNQISVSQAGTYYVSVTNACGTYTDSVNIAVETPQPVSLGLDISSCTANSVSLKFSSPVNGSILWSDGSSGDSLVVNSSGSYWVSVSNACGTFSDTINVALISTTNLFPADTVIYCPGVVLNSPLTSGTHLWSTGGSGFSASITQPGTYWLQVTLPCGTFADTIYFKAPQPLPVVSLGPDISICGGQTIVLDAQNPGYVYQWSTGATGQMISVSSPGKYWAGVNNGCGFVYDTININTIPLPNPVIDDTIYVCQNNTATVDAGNWGMQTTYLWSNNFSGRVNTVSQGAHWVKIYNGCDTVTKYFYVDEQYPLNVHLGNDTTFCGTQLWVHTLLPAAGNVFLWSDGSLAPSLKITKSGSYWVNVTNACGTYGDTINVTINKKPSSIARDSISKCVGSGLWLKTAKVPGTTYLWSNGGNAEKIYVTAPGMYSLLAYNQCDTIEDSIKVIDVNPLHPDLGADTAFCKPASLSLDLSGLPADSIVWSSGSRNSTITIHNTGTYWVKTYNLCGVFTDTIHVTVNKQVQKILKDTSYCAGSSVLLNASQPQGLSYLWNTLATTSSINVSSAGWYYVDITGICGTRRDSVFVSEDAYLPSIDLGNDTIFCAGTMTLDPGYFANADYVWSTGANTQSINISSSGTYYVSVSNSCNTVHDTVEVLVTGPPVLSLGNSIKFCAGSTLTLNAQNPGSAYLWNTGDTTQTINATNNGFYWVTITNDCGFLTDTLELIVENPLTNLSLGNDTMICKGDSLLLQTGLPGVSTKWSTGSFFSQIYVKTTGYYWVQVSNSCGTWEDTIYVAVQDAPVFSLGADGMICAEGGSQLLSGPIEAGSYLWNDGSRNRQLLATAPGKYWLTITNECFSYTDTMELLAEYPLEVNFGPDTVLCYGDVLHLDLLHTPHGKKGNTNYPEKGITESGFYWAWAENSCGIFGDTINVQFENYPGLQTIDTTICDGDSAIFDLSRFSDIEWYDGSREKTRLFGKAGVYPVSITNKCGTFEKRYAVEVLNCECPFFIPDAFTPNNDGNNDQFRVGHSCEISGYSIQIFNRWGQMVYEGNNPDEGWDGNFGGREVPQGVFTYKIYYKWYVYGTDRDNEHTGTITLIR